MARMSADQRRHQVLRAATVEFARSGYHGASTQTIAEKVGLSQPYLFQLFGTKHQMFIDAWNVCCDRVETVLFDAAADLPERERGRAMASAYDALLSEERELLTMQLQAWSASCMDEAIRAAVAKRFNGIWNLIGSLSSSSGEAIPGVMGGWVLYNVAAALQLDRIDECTVTGAWERASTE